MTRNNGGTDNNDDPTGTGDTHWRQLKQRLYDPDQTGDLTTEIVYAIGEAADVPPSDVKSPPLYETIDVAAIEETFFSSDNENESRQGIGTIEFRYVEYRIKVRSDGWIQVYEPTEPGLT